MLLMRLLVSIYVSCMIFASLGQPLYGQNGWRMDGYDGQRTYHSTAIGPSALPQFSQIITDAPAPLRLIAPDGSLVFFDGNTLHSYTSSGTLRWRAGIPPEYSWVGVAVLIGPDGTIYSVTANYAYAWDGDTGAAVWPRVLINIGNERGPVRMDRAGTLYINTAAGYVGYPAKLTAVTAKGAIKWDNPGSGDRGFWGPIVSADETLVYFRSAGVYSANDGSSVYHGSAPGDIQFAAPSSYVYSYGAVSANPGIAQCDRSLFTCNRIGEYDDLPLGVITTDTILSRSGVTNTIRAYNTQGTRLWSKDIALGQFLSDATGTIFGVDAVNNDVVAINGSTGAEVWRYHFTSTLKSVLLGDDGRLYVSAGSSTWRTQRAQNPVILVHGFCAGPSAFGNAKTLLTTQNLHVYTFDYSAMTTTPTGPQAGCSVPSAQDYTVEQIATCFGQFVRTVREKEQGATIDVVAHSEGGLVARTWMTGLSDTPYSGEIARLATIGTPHYGHPLDLSKFTPKKWADLWTIVSYLGGSGGCSQTQALEMSYGSDFILSLHEAWVRFQSGPYSLTHNNMLLIAATANDTCNGVPDVRNGITGKPCNDGLVDVKSAVVPQPASTAAAGFVRYVPYKHCDNCWTINDISDSVPVEHNMTDSTHKTYQAVNRWLAIGSPPDQCCGAGTLDYTPAFTREAAEGLLILRVRDRADKHKAPNFKSVSFPALTTNPTVARIEQSSETGITTVVVTGIPVSGTHTIVLTFDGYESQTASIMISSVTPAVPDIIELRHK